ncbi:hypothetical protein BKA59DRAFT_477387 [Fusarium tricinctum]|jgi:hypothetical protein|uniref:Uncharacterized protein n=1 Tax=Fusarium tricinctum TaxID=61284 RepID=A0A8K0S1K8_9HYPO|nr:hypothetical protein BKA59DRAFT_477387 [Fusarium tricinctum]
MLRDSKSFLFTGRDDQMWQNIRSTLAKFENIPDHKILGSNDESRCVVALLTALCRPHILDRLKTTWLFNPPPQEEQRYLNKQRALFESLRVFSIASWWNRTSIIQEVSAARVLYFVYRKHHIPFELLRGFLEMDDNIHRYLVAEK